MITCRNHPHEPATHDVEMAAPTKQADGSYRQLVPLCERCAERVARLGPYAVNRR